MWKKILNPETKLFFKDIKDATDDKVEEFFVFGIY